MISGYGNAKYRAKDNGFTIVELLVVIVVIAILATISVVAYTGVQERARDSRRLSDLRAMATAIDLYHADHGVYPAVTGGLSPNAGDWRDCISSANSSWWNTCWSGNTDDARLVPAEYMQRIPADPVNYDNGNAGTYANAYTSRLYCYRVKPDLSGYMLGTWLERGAASGANRAAGEGNIRYCNFANYLIRGGSQ